MPVVTMNLTDAELERLNQLARAKNKSPEACIKGFIAACQPGGSGWKHPEDNAKKPQEKASP